MVYTSQVVTIEAQVEYIVSCILQMDERGIGSIDVRADVQREFVRATDRRLATSVWNAGGCSSYYLVDGRPQLHLLSRIQPILPHQDQTSRPRSLTRRYNPSRPNHSPLPEKP